jgi:hypothetical protein
MDDLRAFVRREVSDGEYQRRIREDSRGEETLSVEDGCHRTLRLLGR